MKLLVDTNVVSELRKVRQGLANPNVTSWAVGVDAADLSISAITIEELEIGILRMGRRDPAQGLILRLWMEDSVLRSFDGRILPVDVAVAERSANLQVPNPRPFRDALIAATALVHGLPLVTRNVADFAPMGVAIVNPWMI